MQVEGTKEIIHKVLQFIEDIKTYLQRGDYFITNQYRIGYKYLFQGFIVRDWYRKEVSYYCYVLQNEPILKEYITLREHQKLINQFSVIKAEQDHDFDLAKKYQMCFNAFLNATDDVSIRVCDKDLIKNVDVKDAFILSYFSFGTAKRQEADNLAQLAICGYTYVHFLAIFCFFQFKKN